MAPTDTFDLIDRLIPGGFGQYLTDARTAGESFGSIAARLQAEHDIEVTSETVRRWCVQREIPKEAAS